MALALRLAGNQFRSQFLRCEKSKFLNFVRPVTLQPTQASVASQIENYDERNAKLGRPQSPHLTIYKPQLTSMLSISHRTTGIILTGYAAGLALVAVGLPMPIEHYIDAIAAMNLGTATIAFGKFYLAFPLTYHFFNGIRHLLWDTGKFLTLKEVYTTGYIMLLLSFISAAALSFM